VVVILDLDLAEVWLFMLLNRLNLRWLRKTAIVRGKAFDFWMLKRLWLQVFCQKVLV
jgi:hypothetical protein